MLYVIIYSRGDFMKKYNFLYTTDNNYFIHMLTSIYSLLENNKDIYLNIHIIEDNLSELNKNRLYYLSSAKLKKSHWLFFNFRV